MENTAKAPLDGVDDHSTNVQAIARQIYLKGWRGYFGICETPSVLSRLDRWIRRRLRSIAWKQWKHGRTRFAELRRRGVGHDLAAQTAGSAHGPWRISNSPALAIALRTHSSLASALLALPPPRPHNQPNRPVRTRMQGGVGGEEPRGSPLSRLARIRSEKFGAREILEPFFVETVRGSWRPPSPMEASCPDMR
ncbi:hypothetical protein NKI25_31760 [Mesorhizobium sp. M0808]|uniref:group II intron maturase-specific domain-containing protein n=1 Tax=Mesorhizobium sp. M0808 TaxID=2957002 RepID=UPI00333BDC0C